MKKTLFFAATVAMACLFTACEDCDDCATGSLNPPSKVNAVSVTEVQDALYLGVPNITLTQALTADTTLTIPNSYAPNQHLILNLPAASHSITINQGSGFTGSLPVLNLDTQNTDDLTINTPDMSVYFSGNVNGTLTSTTGPNTLTIKEEGTVDTLAVQKGNVYVFGTVSNYGTIASGSKIVRAVSSGQQLVNMLAQNASYNNGVVLTADIHDVISTNVNAPYVIGLESSRTNPATAFNATSFDGYIFDGNGHTIGGAGLNSVLLVCANSVVVKDLTIHQNANEKSAAYNAVVSGTTLSEGNNGISIYRSKNVVLDNVKVIGTDKAGVIISSSTVTATKLTTESNKLGGVNITGGVASQYDGDPAFTFVSGNLSEQDHGDKTGPYKLWVDLNTLSSPTDYSVTFKTGNWESALNPSNSNQRYYYPVK